MPEELWMEVHDIVQEAVIKTIPKEKNAKRQNGLSDEALQIAEKRREAKGKISNVSSPLYSLLHQTVVYLIA